ncbi:hypothetical protein [Massilia sp. Dwa41.01b]|uniref:hypothetical protein n=1 Tax=Massilia sp. Dwa41.01b TaxID=2709302 RepID=UPI001E4A24FD|nr:hypothetical protein [Massilia sp. Dwa41.01b]
MQDSADSAKQAAAEAFERIGGDTASVAAAATAAAVSESASPGASHGASHGAPTPAHAEAAVQSSSDFVLPTETAPQQAAEVVTSVIAPDAEPTPIAKATVEALEVPLAPPHPLAASVPVEVAVEIELPRIEPVVAAPPSPAHDRSRRNARHQGSQEADLRYPCGRAPRRAAAVGQRK